MLVLQIAVLLLLPSAELLLLRIVVHLVPNDLPIEPLIPRIMIVLVLMCLEQTGLQTGTQDPAE